MVALATAFIRLRPKPDKTEFAKSGKEMGKEAGAAAGESFGKEYTRGADGKLRDSRGKFVKDSEKAGGEAGRKTGRSFNKGLKDSSKGSSAFSTALGVLGAKYTLVGGAAAASLPAVIHFGAAIAPATGALIGLAAGLSAVATANVTFKIATAGVGDAIKAGMTGTAKQAKKALDELPPSAKKFSLSIIALKPQIDKLRAAVSERFFRPLTDDIKPLAQKYFPLLRREMADLAGPLGGLGEQVAESARKADTFKAVGDLFTATKLSVINLRGAIDPLIKAFAVLIQSTAPDLPKLASGIAGAARGISKYITNAVDTGKVNRAFDAGIQTLKDLGGIVVNVGSIIHSVFAAATADGNTLLSSLRDLTGQAADFLKSAQGTAALQSVFGTLASLGDAMKTSLGAILPAVAQSLQILAPAISGLAGPVATLVTALAPLLPIFAGIAANLITQLTPAIAALAGYLSQHAGAVKAAVAVTAAFLAIQKVTSFFLAVEGAGGLVKYIKQVRIVSAVTKIWAGIQAAFNLIMKANTIVLVITLIAAFVAAIIVAYKKSDTFRAIVQAAWQGIKNIVSAVVTWFTGTALPAIKGVFSAISDAAVSVYRNAILPAWHGIQAAISVAVAVITPVIKVLVGTFKVIIAIVTFLYRNVFSPYFAAMKKIVEIWFLAAEIVMKAFYLLIKNTIIAVLYILKTVFKAIFIDYIYKVIILNFYHAAKAIFEAFVKYVAGPFVGFLRAAAGVIKAVFSAIAEFLRNWYKAHIVPIFKTVKTAWDTLAGTFGTIYRNKIKPLFDTFVDFFKDKVVGGFKTGVAAIKKAWDKVKEYATKPVAFVVNKIINPFIGGLNAAAKVVGIKDRVDKIGGFEKLRDGGLVGHRGGGKISGSGGISDNRQAMIPGRGAVQLRGGEFVVNPEATAKALPWLQALNAGMRHGGPRKAAKLLGRPMADMPGDGSEGWAFRDGGVVGWAKDVWGAISNPIEAIKKPFDALLKKVPGLGMIKNFVVGGGKKLLSGALSWVKKIAGGGGAATGDILAAQNFLRAQNGKPYVWASAGPSGYDCSGIVSAVYNLLHGKNPYSHTFSTESAGSFFTKAGDGLPLTAGWSHPGQSPASNSVGHMMGRVGNLTFESTGSRGVHLAQTTRKIHDFANVGHYRGGGLLAKPVQLFDRGGDWPTGTLGANLSGRTEYVNPRGRGGAEEIHIHLHNSVVASDKQAEDLLVKAYNSAKKNRRIT